MHARIAWFCLVGTLGASSIGACRQIAGITDSPPEALTSIVCGLRYGTSECAACASGSCCTESTACAADPECAVYESCLGDCKGDAECRSQCTIDHPVGIATDVTALSTCLASRCETACGLTCGGIADLISPPSAARACEQCLLMSACPKAEACASSTVCDEYTRAEYAFSTSDSVEVNEANLCASDEAAGMSVDIDGLVDVCGAHPGIDVDAGTSSAAGGLQFDCATACATGNYWACVGHVNWPPPKTSSCTIGFRVDDYVTGATVGGALLQVCSPTDDNCSEPLAHGTTDANGMLSLPVPNTQMSGSQGLNGFIRISGTDLFTEDVYWGFPLVEASYPVFQTRVATAAENQMILGGLQVKPIDGRGQLTVFVTDCRFQEAPGVNVTLSTTVAGGFSSTGTTTTATDKNGLIFFVNVPAGVTEITATPGGLDGPSSRTTVYVQPGIQTVAYVWKAPSQ